MDITKYLDSNLILFLEGDSREKTLDLMVNAADRAGKLKDKIQFHQALIEREKIVSTSVGMGVAIPHAKLPDYDDFFIVIAILKRGVEWNALDGAPVKLVFMIGGPDDKQTDYLKILSAITSAIKDEGRRKKILSLDSPEEIMKLFKIF